MTLEALLAATEPFERWIDAAEKAYGIHADDVMIAGVRPAMITFGDLRKLREVRREIRGETVDIPEKPRENLDLFENQ